MIKSKKLKVIVSSCFAVGVSVGLYLATADESRAVAPLRG